MKRKIISIIFITLIAANSFASDTSLDFALSDFNLPIQNPVNGDPSISMVFLEADFTFHARSIALNGFMRDTAGFIWAAYGTCRYTTGDDQLYCAFNVENVSVYFSMSGPNYSGQVTAVDNSGNVFDQGFITAVGS